MQAFLAEVQLPVEKACFGVAGPVVGGRSQITNLAWVVDAARLAAESRLSKVALLNDLEAVAYAVASLRPVAL